MGVSSSSAGAVAHARGKCGSVEAGDRRATTDFFLLLCLTPRSTDPTTRLGRPARPGAQLKRDEPLAPYTTFRIGGPADLFYDATSADDLANAVIAARAAGDAVTSCSASAPTSSSATGLPRAGDPKCTPATFASPTTGKLWCESGAIIARADS